MTASASSSAPFGFLPTTTHNDSRKQWLEQSILRRMVAPVKTTVGEYVAISPFLCAPPPPPSQQQRSAAAAAVFARHELTIDPTPLGTGGFSTVHAITDIQLDARISARCTPVQQRLRENMRDNVWMRGVEGSEEDQRQENDDNEDVATPRFVLKHLQRQLLWNNPKAFQSALRDLALEVEYMGRLSHPNILPLLGRPLDGLDAMSSGQYDAFFLITERLETTLSYQIKEWNVCSSLSSSGDDDAASSTPTWERRVPYMEQLGQALAYLHRHRIVFRDLKPANVGITNRGTTIKLFDFGLCRDLPATLTDGSASTTTARAKELDSDDEDDDEEASTYEMSGVGTQRYMAYEVLAGLPYNCQVDVYSWALLSWEMLTGCRPYFRHGNRSHKMAVLQFDERPNLPDHWPAWLRTVMTKSWNKDLAERVTMAEALAMMARATTTGRRHLHQRAATTSTITTSCAAPAPLTPLKAAPARPRPRPACGVAHHNNNVTAMPHHHAFLREQTLASLRQQQQQQRPSSPPSVDENQRPPLVRLAVPVRISSVYW